MAWYWLAVTSLAVVESRVTQSGRFKYGLKQVNSLLSPPLTMSASSFVDDIVVRLDELDNGLEMRFILCRHGLRHSGAQRQAVECAARTVTTSDG